MKQRVVITGLGVISALGDDSESFWQACLSGRSSVAPIPEQWREYADFRSSLWSPLAPVDFESLGFTRMERMQFDPVTLLAAASAGQALSQAGLEPELSNRRANLYKVPNIDGQRCGVFMGTGVGGVNSFMLNHARHLLCEVREELTAYSSRGSDEDRRQLDPLLRRMAHSARFNPFVVSMLMPNAVAAYTGIKYSLTGENTTSTLACASGTVAIGKAWQAISEGRIDLALAGGSEFLSDTQGCIFQGFDACRTLVRNCEPPDQANRPFDEARSGFLFSEGGAAVLVLENAEAAQARGATPLAAIDGYAESFDASSMMIPSPAGLSIETMLRQLLEDSGSTAEEIDYINAHGTSTQSNDSCEAAVIDRVFGKRVHVNSTKSLLGHTLGASGALEAVVTTLSLRDQTTHPSLNINNPVADLNFVTRATPLDIRRAISQSFGFGGHNAAILLSRLD